MGKPVHGEDRHHRRTGRADGLRQAQGDGRGWRVTGRCRRRRRLCRPAGKNGQLEKLDFSVIDKSKLDPRFVTDYSVGSFYYSFVIGCNADAVSACPKTWADLFDTTKFPGKRTFYKWSALA